MKKLFVSLFLLSLTLTSCLYEEPSFNKAYEIIVKEQNYQEVFLFSSSTTYKNHIIPKDQIDNPYATIYYCLGTIDNVETLYIYGFATYAEIFDPFIYDWPLKHNYDSCLNLFKENIKDKEFNKTKDDKIEIITLEGYIDEKFKNTTKPDDYFVLKYENTLVYEINEELMLKVI